MTKQNIINNYNSKINLSKNQLPSLDSYIISTQSTVNELKSPVSQIDEKVAELTVDLNKEIYNLSIISNEAFDCGCGTTTFILNYLGIGYTAILGDMYYYEHAKAHRINAENPSYSDIYPYEPLNGTDGSTSFNSGIGNSTIVVGADSNSILELIVNNPGSGFLSSTYYAQPLTGGSGSGAKADIVVSTGGSITNVIVNNGGNGYSVNDTLTSSNFVGASFRVTDIGSPILGIGVDTYIVASSGIGSVFIPDIIPENSSSCPTSCSTYKNQADVIISKIERIRYQRDEILSGSNAIKVEMKQLYTERYSYVFGKNKVLERNAEINNLINVLNTPEYNQYFV
jgi:hypothetical protein